MLVKCQRPAMATEFAIWLVGDDEEALTAIGEAALDEVERVESVLSRFDPASEVARINRILRTREWMRPIVVSVELLQVLERCIDWCVETNGVFHVSRAALEYACEWMPQCVRLDRQARTATFRLPGIELDFGGYGKGYALDCAARIVKQFGVESALLHGGTSSVLAIGGDEAGNPWRIGLRDPSDESMDRSCGDVFLRDNSLSSSGRHLSPWYDRMGQKHVPQPEACSVVCDSGEAAEVYSTTLLGMGKREAIDYLRNDELLCRPNAVAFIEIQEGQAVVDWIRGGTHAELD